MTILTHVDSSKLGVNDAGTSVDIDTRLTQACSPDVLGFTYFIRAGDAIKIGSAINFKRRLGSLQTSHEKSLDVLAVFSASAVDEYSTHLRFVHLRIRGEWFRADKELLQFIDYAKIKFGEAVAHEKPPKQMPAPKRHLSKDQRYLRSLLTSYETADAYYRPALEPMIRTAWKRYQRS